MCISILQISYYVYQYTIDIVLYVCMYVSMYLCMYVCMYLCIYAYMYVCMYVCMYVFSILQISYCMYLVPYKYRIMCIQHKTIECRKARFIGIRVYDLCLSLIPDLYDKTYLVSIAVRKAIGISTSCLISAYRVICIQYNIDILL